MEIIAKYNKIPLKKHIEDLLVAVRCLPYKKLDYEKLKVEDTQINREYFERLLDYAIVFHDLGKVSPSFQKKVGNESFDIKIDNFSDVRHNILSLFFINKGKVKELVDNSESLYATFLSAIAFHHWKKDEKEYLLHLNENLIKAAKILLENENGKRLEEALKRHLGEKIEVSYNGGRVSLEIDEYISFDTHMAKQISEGGSLISVNVIPPYTLYFLPERLRLEAELKINLHLWIYLAGFLIRVDHFVSFIEKENKDISPCQIEKKLEKANIKEKLEEKFRGNFWQKEELKDKEDKNIILIAPTGVGKTEFAFLWAEGEKIFYTLPIRVATNQMFERACKYFNKKWVDPEDPFINGNVGLLHSDADLYLLEKWENAKSDLDGETPKILDLSRHFSLPINICTGDQIFPSALKYPQYEKIYSTLGYSRLGIDEIQAYDPIACAIILKMIEDVTSLGGKFLLMTATLPEFVKKHLIERKIIKEEDIIDLYQSKIEKDKIGEDFYRHKIELVNRDIKEDIEKILEKARDGKRVLVVVNTVEKAEEVYKEIKAKTDSTVFCEILHSRFTLIERKRKERKLESKFKNPKPKEESVPKILVATQVIEASLDIDADYLFTEIVPIDSLVQRMGRVMRRVNVLTGKVKKVSEKPEYKDFYEDSEPFRYESFYKDSEPNVYIYYLVREKRKEGKRSVEKEIVESGEGRVYPKYLISETYRILERITKEGKIIEKDKQGLVEELYRNVRENTEYLKEFYETLRILDAGYISENFEEAHNLFRRVYTIPLIEGCRIKKIADRIKQKVQKDGDITWIWFKRKIIAKYVINDYMWRYRQHRLKSLFEMLAKEFEESGVKIERELREKIKRYSEGIWVFLKDESEVSERII